MQQLIVLVGACTKILFALAGCQTAQAADGVAKTKQEVACGLAA
jgi:hypothetical protein